MEERIHTGPAKIFIAFQIPARIEKRIWLIAARAAFDFPSAASASMSWLRRAIICDSKLLFVARGFVQSLASLAELENRLYQFKQSFGSSDRPIIYVGMSDQLCVFRIVMNQF